MVRVRRIPNRVPREPVTPPDKSWRGMSADRIRMATNAVCGHWEDVTDEERDALQEFLRLGGNVAGL